MKVIIPGIKEQNANPFFEEIIRYSKFDFIYQTAAEITPGKNNPILFQWPELIFNWAEPTFNQLDELEIMIKEWKLKTKIIYLVHNERRHFGVTPQFERLYQIVESAADIMVHFGRYSQTKFSKKYPFKEHVIISHPLYFTSFQKTSKVAARKKINIPEDRVVLIAPGRIRNEQERSLLLKAFKYFPSKRKTLIAPFMIRKPSKVEFRGRHLLKKLFDIKKFIEKRGNDFKPPKYYVGYNFSKAEDLSLLMSAADAVIIPRIEILNSGNVFLALTFNLPVIGPAVGNVGEVLKDFNLPVFDPAYSGSIKMAIKELDKNCIQDAKNYNIKSLQKYTPKSIAKKWDALIDSVLCLNAREENGKDT